MNILLITPSFENSHRSKGLNLNNHYPLGLAYLHAVLERDHFVKTMFLNDYGYEDCILATAHELSRVKYDMVCFNMLTPNRVMCFKLMEYVHHTCPNSKIIVGGIHATVLHEQIASNFKYVVVCRGEGEETLKELTHKKLSEIDGITYWDNGLKINHDRELIDVEKLPIPKHEIFMNDARRTAALLTARGCPFNCSFCVLESVSRRKVRYRSPENVLNEIEWLSKTYPQLNQYWIHDDTFTLNEERAIKICEGIIKMGIKKNFVCSARIKPFSKELMDVMYRAGFVNILFGMESGSDTILNICRKKITVGEIMETIKITKDYPIHITCFLMVGLPGESDETVMETIKTVNYLQSTRYIPYQDIGVTMVYPGTEVYNIMTGQGIMNDNYWLTNKEVPFYTAENTVEQLFKWKKQILDKIQC